MAKDEQKTGKVIKKIEDKGFGFITDGEGVEHFFHRSSVRDNGWDALRVGQAVTFTVTLSPKGPRAENVMPASQTQGA